MSSIMVYKAKSSVAPLIKILHITKCTTYFFILLCKIIFFVFYGETYSELICDAINELPYN